MCAKCRWSGRYKVGPASVFAPSLLVSPRRAPPSGRTDPQMYEDRRPPARGKRKRAISPTRADVSAATDSASVQRSDRGATSLLSAMWAMLPETHDVQLLISEAGEDVLLCAHRAVLAASSRYFKSLLCGECKERATATVPLHDVSARSVRGLLRFVYGQRVELTVEKALPLYRVSDMYEVFSSRT